MKWLSVLALTLSVVYAIPAGDDAAAPRKPQGIDVSSNQPQIDWKKVKSNGVDFAYVKATEGTHYQSPEFDKQYTGASGVGIIRGAYHFGLPDKSSGAAQAKFFLEHGGGWTADGKTLPGALDIEFNPYGQRCYGKRPAEMVDWIRDFSDAYQKETKRYPVIYTNTNWWKECTGNANGFAKNNPLWVARFGKEVGELPAGYKVATIWQYANKGPNPGDQDVFMGNMGDLQKFVRG
ncbi:glycoside hydrolase family 25 protein [Amanita thiersii Skay4041]|uniref:N,O-diacetylmuramidase n=1 Tax=Amanita thiersii Skay4041 TaxID=703135 RepID=A0A2A9NQJ4_9AGAR|nr:glycoside hydrolase family 25 protein [Amanita thiersii Skay4041]